MEQEKFSIGKENNMETLYENNVNAKKFVEEVKCECVKRIWQHADSYNNGNLIYPLEDSIDLWFYGVAKELAEKYE